MRNSTALQKLKQDILRFEVDRSFGPGLVNFFRLLLIVDFWPVLWFRLMEYTSEKDTVIRRVTKIFIVLFRPISEGASGARILPGAEIGGGLLLHQSVGVVVASESKIGCNCTLFSGACVVHKADDRGTGAPVVGDDVSIMSGAKVVGGITIGDAAVVGANAVLLNDLPPGCLAVGIPAKIIQRFGKN